MKVLLDAEREIAFDSPDHLMPWGTRHDNSTHHRFSQKLWRMYPNCAYVRVLDLGCAGGGFVRSCINDGQFAIGLEGSDFSKKHKRAEWAHIPEFLFTCDITRPFQLSQANGSNARESLRFDVITAWEFIEHIREQDLPGVTANVHRHLIPGGLWILSVANFEDVINGVRLHQTVRPKTWWRDTFNRLGFVARPDVVQYFKPQFVRGTRKETERSFHLVLTNDRSRSPRVPGAESLQHRLFDLWNGSTAQLYLRKLVGI